MRNWYAAQHPRGFANEVEVRRFESKPARDDWVAAHRLDGGQNSAAQGAVAVSANEARRLMRCEYAVLKEGADERW